MTRALLALLLLAALPALADHSGGVADMVCVRAIDGDSLVVAWGPLQIEVRIEDVDAPEWNQPGGPEATAAAARIAAGKACRLVYKDKGRVRDRYGRTLARVEVDDSGEWIDFSAAMVAGGFATWRTASRPSSPPDPQPHSPPPPSTPDARPTPPE